jgi:hypothetical protein
MSTKVRSLATFRIEDSAVVFAGIAVINVKERKAGAIGSLMRSDRGSKLLRRVFEVNIDVIEVILRVLTDESAVFVGEFAAELGRNARPKSAGRDVSVLGNDRAGCDDAALADAGVVQNADSHADDAHIFDNAAVNRGVVADGHPVTHDDGIEVALAVENGAVLDIGPRADADGVDVAA